MLLLFCQFAPGRIKAEIVSLRQRGQDRGMPLAAVDHLAPRGNRALAQTQFGVSYDQFGVDLLLRSQAGAGRAGAVRAVEAEGARRDLWQADAAIDAGRLFRKENFLAIHHFDQHHAVAQLQRRLQRICQSLSEGRINVILCLRQYVWLWFCFRRRAIRARVTICIHIVQRRAFGHCLELRALAEREGRGTFFALPPLLAYRQAINHNFQRVFLLLIQFDFIAQINNVAINAHTDVAGAAHLVEDILIFALAPLYQRCQQHDARAFGQSEDSINDLLDGLLAHLAPALWAMLVADARIEQAQIVMNLRHRADRRARVVRRSLLINRDRGGEAIDMVDVRFLHLVQELAGIGGKRLDIAALPLGENGVKGQAALARPGEARDDHQLIAGDRHIDILQIMFASAANNNFILRHTAKPSIETTSVQTINQTDRLIRNSVSPYPLALIQTFNSHTTLYSHRQEVWER